MFKNNCLQQQNFKEIIQKMVLVPGWEILEQGNLLALKSPVPAPLVNMVWGNVTEKHYANVMDFYKGAEFYWLLDLDQVNNIPDKLKHLFIKQGKYLKFPEMFLNLHNYIKPANFPGVDIIIPKTKDELQIWTKTAISTLDIKETDFQQFFYPLIDLVNSIPLLLYYNGQPAGIYTMSTKEKFRRKSVGSAAIHACLKIAKSYDLKYAVLYASKLGMYLYKAVGFEVAQYFYEFNFKNELKL
ncbi:MAG: hypothetical protein ACK5Z5_00765 [Neisseriaceae bacterium]|jgi:GNAT superfamily N-acetyltransferase